METLIESINSALQTFGLNLPVMIITISLAGVATIGHLVNGGSLKVPVFVAILVAALFWSGLSGCKLKPRVGDIIYEICTTEAPVGNGSLTFYYRDESRKLTFYLEPAEPTESEPRWCVRLWRHKFEFESLSFELALMTELQGETLIRRTELLKEGKVKQTEVPISVPNRHTVITILETTGPVIKF